MRYSSTSTFESDLQLCSRSLGCKGSFSGNHITRHAAPEAWLQNHRTHTQPVVFFGADRATTLDRFSGCAEDAMDAAGTGSTGNGSPFTILRARNVRPGRVGWIAEHEARCQAVGRRLFEKSPARAYAQGRREGFKVYRKEVQFD